LEALTVPVSGVKSMPRKAMLVVMHCATVVTMAVALQK